jgi:hypothetical protein
MSEAILEMQMKFVGTQKIIKGQLERNLAPLTIQAMMDIAPFTRRAMMNVGAIKSYLMILIEIKRGREKTVTQSVSKGDIVYDPMQDAIYIIYKEGKLRNPVLKLGVLSEGLDIVPTVTNGTMVEISFKDLTTK